LVGIIIISSVFIPQIIVEFLFKLPPDYALCYSTFLILILSPILSLLILDKFIKKIFNYLNDKKREKLLKLKKNSKTLYIYLAILSYTFKNILFIMFFILLSLILLPLSLKFFGILIKPILIKFLKTPFLISRIIQKSSTNPSLIYYLYITTQAKSIANFYEVNDELELILASKELLNYLESLPLTELTREEIESIGKFILLAKDPERIDKIISLTQTFPADSPNDYTLKDNKKEYILYDDDYIRIIHYEPQEEEKQ